MPEALTWARLYGRRLDWAMQARQDLIGSLEDEDVRQFYESAPGQEKEKACVAVLGTTQVGKTTVILHLLGLTAEGGSLVNRLLRGNREAGQSATASAAIYGCSPDEQFRYKEPEKAEEALDRETFGERLTELRARVEAGRFGATDAVALRFPASCFGPEADYGLHVIDLPGLDARNKAEQDQTMRLINRYLPLAPLVLLVERAENVASLGYLPVPGAGQQWLLFPERYALVLTRAMSARSVQEHLIAGTIQTLPELKDYHHKALRRIILGSALHQGQDEGQLSEQVDALKVYPVDLGDSRETLGGSVPLDVVDRLTAETSSALRGSVRGATTFTGKLALTAGLYRGAMKVKSDQQRRFIKKAEGLDEEIEQATSGVQGQENLVVEYYHDARKAASECHLDEDSVLKELVSPLHVGAFESTVTVPSLKKYVNEAGERCDSVVRAALKRADAEYPQLGLDPGLPQRARTSFEEGVERFRIHLNRYKGLKSLVPHFLRSERGTQQRASVVPEAAKAAVEVLEKEIREAVRAENERAEAAQNEAENLWLGARQALAPKRSQLKQLKWERSRIQREHEERIERIDRDIDVGRRFHEFLRERFDEAFHEGKARLDAPDASGPERIHTLAYLHLVTEEYSQLTGQTQVANLERGHPLHHA